MYDLDLARQILRQILWSTETIRKRFEPIRSAVEFRRDERGLEKLDAICMQLIAIGESVKDLDKVTAGSLLPQYPEIEWKQVMGIRDVLSHHYFDIDEEVVFAVCTDHLASLTATIRRMLKDLPPSTSEEGSD